MLRRVVIGCLALAISGCGASATTSTSATTVTTVQTATTVAETRSTTTTEPPLVFESFEFEGDLPRAFTYKGLEWTVTGARVSNQDHSRIASIGDPVDEYSVTVDLTVASAFRETLVRFDLDDLFRLDLGDGDLMAPITDVETDLAPNDSVGPGETGSISVDFAGDPSVDLAGATLVIGETGYRPVELPLMGPVPESGYPVELDLAVEQEIVLEAGCFTDPALLEIEGGRLGLDIVVDEDDVLNVDPDTGEVTPVSRRAPNGSRFVELDLRVSAGSAGACGGTLVGADDFLVDIAGTLRAHDWDPGIYASEALKSGEEIEFGVGYTIPDDLETLVLLAGVRSDSPVRIEIALPLEP